MRPKGWMPSAAATVEPGGDLIAVSSDMETGAEAPAARPMRLEGVEALQLYLVEIEQNLALLAQQIALLKSTLAERRRLLCRIAAEQQAPRPMH